MRRISEAESHPLAQVQAAG